MTQNFLHSQAWQRLPKPAMVEDRARRFGGVDQVWRRPVLSARRQEHWFSIAGHSLGLARFVPSLGPSQQAESRVAAALAQSEEAISVCMLTTQQQLCAVVPGTGFPPTFWALQWNRFQEDSQGWLLLFFFFSPCIDRNKSLWRSEASC